jgi:hypothetical protein
MRGPTVVETPSERCSGRAARPDNLTDLPRDHTREIESRDVRVVGACYGVPILARYSSCLSEVQRSSTPIIPAGVCTQLRSINMPAKTSNKAAPPGSPDIQKWPGPFSTFNVDERYGPILIGPDRLNN